MIMADVLTWFLVVVGLLIVFNCYWLAARALFPGTVEQARAAYLRPLRITGLGLVLTAPIVAFGVLLAQFNHPIGRILGFSTLALAIFLGLIGSAGLSERIGLGLPSPADETQPWRRVLRGGIVLSFLFLLPFIGWFVLLPWTLISGVGSAVFSIRQARRKRKESIVPESLPAPTTPQTIP